MIKIKKIQLVAVVIAFALILSPAQFFIAKVSANGSTTPTAPSAIANAETTRMNDLKTRADNEIDRRIAALNSAVTRISSALKLSVDQKNMFVSELNAEASDLNVLKTKIDADTDLPTLKTDVQSIVISYRVFALYLPQMYITSASDKILQTVDNLTTLGAKLSARINTAESLGKTVANLKTTYADMLTQLSNAKRSAGDALFAVTPLTPEGYPGNLTQLKAAQASNKDAETSLKAARDDAKTIIDGLISLK